MALSAVLDVIGTSELDAWENQFPTFRKTLTKYELVGFVIPEQLP